MKKFVQFIAGAICPSCKTRDTIALSPEDDQIYCIKCDYKEKRPSEERIDKAEEIRVINIEEFKKKTKKNQ
tara:strand:- start:1816 stop:2028 length:213 start_codon:yes stop_codon:yes gene_type:complete